MFFISKFNIQDSKIQNSRFKIYLPCLNQGFKFIKCKAAFAFFGLVGGFQGALHGFFNRILAWHRSGVQFPSHPARK